jgi:hypothetical protein
MAVVWICPVTAALTYFMHLATARAVTQQPVAAPVVETLKLSPMQQGLTMKEAL